MSLVSFTRSRSFCSSLQGTSEVLGPCVSYRNMRQQGQMLTYLKHVLYSNSNALFCVVLCRHIAQNQSLLKGRAQEYPSSVEFGFHSTSRQPVKLELFQWLPSDVCFLSETSGNLSQCVHELFIHFKMGIQSSSNLLFFRSYNHFYSQC